MPVEVILPKVDMDMETGRISKWFFEKGSVVSKGDVLFEIETNKATMEIDAPASGVLRDITGAEASTFPWARLLPGSTRTARPMAARRRRRVCLLRPQPLKHDLPRLRQSARR